MAQWADHLITLPVLLPMTASAIMLLLDERRLGLKRVISLVTALALIAIALVLVREATLTTKALIYSVGEWPAPFGITLVRPRVLPRKQPDER